MPPKEPATGAASSQASRPVTPQIVWKGAQEFRHDLVRLSLANMKKNVSYIKFQPKLEEIPHVHHFHSHDMKGREMIYSSPVGGHFHEVKIDWENGNPDGTPKISVGPALRSIQKKMRNGKMRTIIEKVRYASGHTDSDDIPEEQDPMEIVYLYDDHTHAGEYKRSEMISQAKIKANQDNDRGKLSAMLKSDPNVVGAPRSVTKEEKGAGGEDDGADRDVGGATLKEE